MAKNEIKNWVEGKTWRRRKIMDISNKGDKK